MRLPRLRRIALGVVITCAVVAALLLLAQDQVTLRLRSDTGAAEPGHAAYVAGLLGAVVAGATVDSDPDPDELHALATIAVARSAIPTRQRRRR